MDESLKSLEIKRVKRRTALWFGLAAGLVYSFTLWGIDGIQLASANAVDPWAKLALGVLPVTALCVLTALACNHFDNGLVNFLLWLAASVLIWFFSIHLPFDGMTFFYRNFDPEIAKRVDLPFNKALMTSSILVLWLFLPLGGISGALFGILVENASNATSHASAFVSLVMWSFLFIACALLLSSQIMVPMRGALTTMDQLVEQKLVDEVTPFPLETARYMHLATLDTAGDLIHLPRRLVIAGYDSMLIQTNIKIDFGGHWMDCIVIADQSSEPPRQQPIYCRDTN